MSTNNYRAEKAEERKRRRAKNSKKLLDDSIKWILEEASSREYGRLELGLAIHKGELKSIRRSASEHVDEIVSDSE